MFASDEVKDCEQISQSFVTNELLPMLESKDAIIKRLERENEQLKEKIEFLTEGDKEIAENKQIESLKAKIKHKGLEKERVQLALDIKSINYNNVFKKYEEIRDDNAKLRNEHLEEYKQWAMQSQADLRRHREEVKKLQTELEVAKQIKYMSENFGEIEECLKKKEMWRIFVTLMNGYLTQIDTMKKYPLQALAPILIAKDANALLQQLIDELGEGTHEMCVPFVEWLTKEKKRLADGFVNGCEKYKPINVESLWKSGLK